jgi:hypothetical protein
LGIVSTTGVVRGAFIDVDAGSRSAQVVRTSPKGSLTTTTVVRGAFIDIDAHPIRIRLKPRIADTLARLAVTVRTAGHKQASRCRDAVPDEI